MNYRLVKIADRPELAEKAAYWFNEKWSVPLEAYVESIADSLKPGTAVPSWYVALDGDKIVGGMGVIENDFHPMKELTPNVCAVYTEEEYRKKGIAGALLNFVAHDMQKSGIDTLYLVTNLLHFYEWYGWEYLCPVTSDGETEPSRMYIHRMLDTFCGLDCCRQCEKKAECGGCKACNGKPLGGTCVAAEIVKSAGKDILPESKQALLEEINALGKGIGLTDFYAEDLSLLIGQYVNLEYPLPSGGTVKYLKDENVYWATQVTREGKDRCYGAVADDSFILLVEYGPNGEEPFVLAYKKR